MTNVHLADNPGYLFQAKERRPRRDGKGFGLRADLCGSFYPDEVPWEFEGRKAPSIKQTAKRHTPVALCFCLNGVSGTPISASLAAFRSDRQASGVRLFNIIALWDGFGLCG